MKMAANILSRYGIKEVADVTFYDILDNGDMGAPVLYLDTLKVSTIEQTAENAEARGGKGNAALISWDYGKEITVTLEDALYSPRSLALIYGDEDATPETLNEEQGRALIKKTLWKQTAGDLVPSGSNVTATLNGVKVTLSNCTFYKANGDTASSTDYEYVTGSMPVLEGAMKIDVSANSFPGTYYVTGDTYARNEATGKDEFFQFIIPKAKVLSESNTITLEAEGDPTVFSMNLKVLRPRDGVMMKLVQYGVEVTQ
jgi:hypothetical protein